MAVQLMAAGVVLPVATGLLISALLYIGHLSDFML
ncbi:MAG: hypothetical protein MESAZ_01847 [Saezia sanguinis]